MSLTLSYSYNMVESTKKKDLKSALENLRICRLIPESLEDDLLVYEMRLNWTKMSDSDKIALVMSEAEIRIIRWHKENQCQKTKTYDQWKRSLREHFKTEKMSLAEFCDLKREKEETIAEFLARLLEASKSLEISKGDRNKLIKRAIRSEDQIIRAILVMSDDIDEKLIQKIKEFKKDPKLNCDFCKKQGYDESSFWKKQKGREKRSRRNKK